MNSKFKNITSPKVLLILTIISIIFIAATIYVEYQARQQDYLRLLERQAALFIETVRYATENALVTSMTVDDKMDLGFKWIANFLRNFQADENIEYVVLQIENTIVAGSFNGYDLNFFTNDRIVQAVRDSDRPNKRILQFGDKLVYETLSPFYFDDVPMGVLRLGLSMKEYQTLQKDVRERLFSFAMVIIVFGLIFINLVINYRHRQILHRDLARLRDYTTTIFDNLSSGVISVDHDGLVRSANKQALLFLSPKSDILDQPFTKLPPEYVDAIRSHLDSGRDKPRIIKKWMGAGQNRRLFNLQSNILTNEDGSKNTVLIINDITDQSQLEEQIRRNQRLSAMRNLAFSVAHEIKNPLNAINLLIDLIRKKFKPVQDEEKLHKYLDTMGSEISRISTIVEQYLRFSRPPALNLSDVQLPELMNEIATLMTPQLQAHNIDLKIDMIDHSPMRADFDQLKQLLINLVKNAQEAIEHDGHISVTGRIIDIYYEISVEDNGFGIPQNDIDAIFDLYFTSKSKGNGVGLSVAQQIIEAHNGTIGVESTEGVGTTFYIRLPLE